MSYQIWRESKGWTFGLRRSDRRLERVGKFYESKELAEQAMYACIEMGLKKKGILQ